MDNEMKNGMRELSMDEMDKVSGGADGMCDRNGKYYSEQQILDLARSMTMNFGYNMAFDTLTTMFNISKTEKSHNGSKTDIQKIEELVYRMMQIADKIEGGGSCY